jgi:hypothetical protein
MTMTLFVINSRAFPTPQLARLHRRQVSRLVPEIHQAMADRSLFWDIRRAAPTKVERDEAGAMADLFERKFDRLREELADLNNGYPLYQQPAIYQVPAGLQFHQVTTDADFSNAGDVRVYMDGQWAGNGGFELLPGGKRFTPHFTVRKDLHGRGVATKMTDMMLAFGAARQLTPVWCDDPTYDGDGYFTDAGQAFANAYRSKTQLRIAA